VGMIEKLSYQSLEVLIEARGDLLFLKVYQADFLLARRALKLEEYLN